MGNACISFGAVFSASCYFLNFLNHVKGVRFFITFCICEALHHLVWAIFVFLPLRYDKFNFLVRKGFIKRISVIGTILNNSLLATLCDNLIGCSLRKFDSMKIHRIRVHGDK